MLAAGSGLGLAVGSGLAGLTSTLVVSLHVGSENLLASFDASLGVSRARAPEESAAHGLESRGGCCKAIYTLLKMYIHGFGSFRKLL